MPIARPHKFKELRFLKLRHVDGLNYNSKRFTPLLLENAGLSVLTPVRSTFFSQNGFENLSFRYAAHQVVFVGVVQDFE